MRKPLAALILLGTLLLAACGEPEPVRIGFLGGLSDRNTDVGDAGRNGVILAVEQWNREGGIQGRLIELIARDDAQNAATAEKSARELAAAKVEAVIGPFTSGVAAAAVPVVQANGVSADGQLLVGQLDGERAFIASVRPRWLQF